MSILVYLDSQDYSNLTKDSELLEELIAFKKSGKISFISSSAIVSECAPITSSSTHLAVARGEIIELLCGRNTFVSIDRIIENEILSLQKSAPTRNQIISSNGDWFPSVGPLIDAVDMRKQFHDAISGRPLNRTQRRRAKSMTLRGSSLRQRNSNELMAGMDNLISTYPMKPQNARTLISFLTGKSSRAQAESALLESLRDVSWMMRWFQDNHKNLSFVPDFIRAPTHKALERFVLSIDASGFVKNPIQAWRKITNEILQENIERLSANSGEQVKPCIEDIATHCPGITTMFRLITTIIEDSLGPNTRKTEQSDFADALHALHAPYVDLFRTDSYMANKLIKIVPKTIICGKLTKLPSAIHALSNKGDGGH